jgi:hypothetical protein
MRFSNARAGGSDGMKGTARTMLQPDISLVSQQNGDVLFTAGAAPSLLACHEVQAICRQVRKYYFAAWQSERFIFEFVVIEPEVYAKTKLEMFCRWNRRWKTPPASSKIYRVAWVASGGLRHRQQVSENLFKGKVFRCRLRVVSPADGPKYTVIDMILEKLTG